MNNEKPETEITNESDENPEEEEAEAVEAEAEAKRQRAIESQKKEIVVFPGSSDDSQL